MSQYDDLPLPPRAGTPSGPAARKPLGKLTQSARGGEIKKAKRILIIIGILNLIGGIALFALAETMADAAIQAELRAQPGVQLDPAVKDELLVANRFAGGFVIGIGALFIFFGLIVQKFPVPITVISLTLYLGLQALDALMDPKSIAQGIIIKVIIIVALVKAVQAAFAYQKEMNASSSQKPMSASYAGGDDL